MYITIEDLLNADLITPTSTREADDVVFDNTVSLNGELVEMIDESVEHQSFDSFQVESMEEITELHVICDNGTPDSCIFTIRGCRFYFIQGQVDCYKLITVHPK